MDTIRRSVGTAAAAGTAPDDDRRRRGNTGDKIDTELSVDAVESGTMRSGVTGALATTVVGRNPSGRDCMCGGGACGAVEADASIGGDNRGPSHSPSTVDVNADANNVASGWGG